ncbi:poly-gamma-glutamate synthesis protein (capsule biosynthesis protein) [Actinocorallia herbida]|uniref:Poly-gamma-glutamate synthesis protein (Capsule biosynthesis protein) n=2 Tax=Actinocorallia herbida TaxID=58109 RepID=A0A3N1DBS4_9ACTN|nr:poly-gamma-glutamate synthesis protein (capsule biosynthesis protein) [Actinocorallia herbida]
MRRLIAVGALLALAGCASSGTDTASEADRGTAGAVFTLAFAGDVSFTGDLAGRLDDPAKALSTAAPQLGAADVTVVHASDVKALPALQAAGVDAAMVGAAEVPADTTMPVMGGTFEPLVANVNGGQVAFFGAEQKVAGDDRLIQAIKDADGKYSAVVVYSEWGEKGQSCPDDAQKSEAAKYIDAGADAVVGSGAGVLQGGGLLKEKYVHYGLGSFITPDFDAAGPTGQTGVLTLTFSGSIVTGADWAPAAIEAPGLPAPLKDEAAQNAYTAWQALTGCAGLKQ